MVINMGYFDNDILTKMMEELDKGIPKTVEEAKEMIKKDQTQYAAIITAANINALIQILINKGILTKEEFVTWYNASEEACLQVAAEKIMKELQDNDFDEE